MDLDGEKSEGSRVSSYGCHFYDVDRGSGSRKAVKGWSAAVSWLANILVVAQPLPASHSPPTQMSKIILLASAALWVEVGDRKN
jgi:hypothetical protein